MGESRAILILDDDEAARRAVARLLTAHGHTVTHAATVAEAMTMLDLQEVVILDLNLPDGLGTDVSAAIRTQGRSIRTVLWTGSPTAGLAGCADALFLKPDATAMIQWIGEQLEAA
jgi:CheY-like chemotaxis protein